MATSDTNIQAERIRSALTTTEFATRGARSYLFVLVAGACSYLHDREARDLEAPCMIWSPAMQTARLSLVAGTRGFVLRIPEKYLGRSIPTGIISAHVSTAISERIIVPGVPAPHVARLNGLFEQIESELFTLAPGSPSAVQHCISLLLIEVWRASNPPHAKADALPHQIVHDFLHLVEMHLQSHWTVAQYAEQIGVSRDRLNSAVQRAVGTSPHRHIQSRLMEEAKSLLLHSNLQVAEIGYKLGFGDATYFNRFFQRHMTVAPGRFRQQNRDAEDAGTFASWP